MDKNQINFLQFRTELIELLDKYKYEISGTNLDDGSMNVENSKGNIYILRDTFSNYEALDNDWNTLSTDYILEMFSERQNSILPLKNKVGVFTNDPSKARSLLEDLYNQNKDNTERYRQSNDSECMDLLLKDGTYYTWIKPIRMSRGHRCSRAYIDKNLTLTELQLMVLPLCVYCERKDVVII